MPAQAGIQKGHGSLGSRLRGNDGYPLASSVFKQLNRLNPLLERQLVTGAEPVGGGFALGTGIEHQAGLAGA